MNKKYLVTTLVLFIIEVIIALFINDFFIRPFVGDALVVVLIYCFIRIFTDRWLHLPWYVFVFAVLVECSQILPLVEVIGLGNYKIARILFGTTFDVMDIIAYLVGTVLIVGTERGSTK